MSLLKAVLVVFIWCWVGLFLMSKGVEISSDMQFLTIAIIAAGVLAGGDSK